MQGSFATRCVAWANGGFTSIRDVQSQPRPPIHRRRRGDRPVHARLERGEKAVRQDREDGRRIADRDWNRLPHRRLPERVAVVDRGVPAIRAGGVRFYISWLRGRSTDTTLPEPTGSSSRVTRRAMRRGARVRPPRSSSSTIPASRSFFSVRGQIGLVAMSKKLQRPHRVP